METNSTPAARPRALAVAWPGLLLATVLLLPFLGKAHTVDDVTFLMQARHVLADPLHPTAFEMVSDGQRIRLSSQLVSGPVMAYLLVPCVLLGGAEWASHLVQLVLVLAAIVATTALALRFGLKPAAARAAGLLLAATPALTAMATTSMADVPAMAFGVIGLERLACGRAERRPGAALAGALALALAALARPHLALLLPIAALLPAAPDAAPRPRFAAVLAAAWPPLVAAAIVLAAIAVTADPQRAHGDVASATLARLVPSAAASNLVAFGIDWLLVLPLALPWAWLRVARARPPRAWLAGALAFALLAVLVAGAAQRNRVACLVLALAGLAAIADVLAGARRDRTRFVLGAWLLLALPALAYEHMACKYLVASAPAAALLVAAAAGEHATGRRIIGANVAAGALLGLLVAHADARFADAGRRAAREFVAPRVRTGERVWVDGSWGFQWYAQEAGAQPLALQPPGPRPGDVLVASAACAPLPLSRFPNRELLAESRVRSRLGRIMSGADGAGFYSNRWGYLPWTWRDGELDDFTVWRIR